MVKFTRKNNKAFTRTPKFGVTPNGGGFTLIETLVAISIFSVSILGLISILSQGIVNTNYAKKKIIASYLAQEGIEYMRNLRDTYVLNDSVSSQNGWNGPTDSFNKKLTDSSCQAPNGCYFNADSLNYSDPTQPMKDISINACVGGVCPQLRYDEVTGKYNYSTGTPSGYTRKITRVIINPNETYIVSSVSWTQGSGNYSTVFSESLFNWIE